MVTVPQPFPIVIDKHEAEDAEWSTADQLLNKHLAGETTLMPPQFYELSRLRDIHTIEDIQTLIELRRKLGIERWFPHIIDTNEGMTSVLPGDELYPENPNLYEMQEIVTHDGSLPKSDTGDQRSYHRMRFRVEASNVGVNITGPPRFGHYYAVPRSKI
jgi:nucleoside diphosphate-linked moiety X motif protein 19